MATEQPEHSPIGASSMDRWDPCPGSVRLSESVKNVETDYAKEGTTAHAKATEWLTLDMVPVFADTMAGREMRAAVSEYVHTCKRYTTDVAIDMGAEWGVEQSFDLSSVYPGCYGTADFWCYWPWLKKLIVLDFKYGAGVFVSPVENRQLLYYALGVLVTKKFPIENIEVGIVQPRCLARGDDNGVRTWEVDRLTLMDFQSDLVAAAKKTKSLNAPLVPGEHCRWCPANSAQICPEIKALAYQQVQHPLIPSKTYNPQELKKALDNRAAIRAYLKKLDEFAYMELQHGVKIPGYKMVDKYPQRSWLKMSDVKNLLLASGYALTDIMEEPALKSPAQIEKLLKKQKDPDLLATIAGHIQSISNGQTVVSEDDERQSNSHGPEAVFTKIINPLE